MGSEDPIFVFWRYLEVLAALSDRVGQLCQ